MDEAPVTTKPRLSSVELLIAEARIHLLRAVAVAMLYGQHLASYFMIQDASMTAEFHHGVNIIVLLCCLIVLVVHLMLRQKRWPLWLTYATIVTDGLLILWLIVLAGGPSKPQVMLLPILILVSALRLLRKTVWLSTTVSIGAYLIALADYAFIKIGPEAYYAVGNESLRIARHDQFFVVIALLICGIIADQLVLQTYRISHRVPIAQSLPDADECVSVIDKGVV